MRRYATPEEAAAVGVPPAYVRVVGTVVRGDEAMVAQLLGTSAAYEIDTATCFRDDGGWVCGGGGNGSAAFLQTAAAVGTYVLWDEAKPGMVAAKFVLGEREQVVRVENGIVLAAFDDVPTSVYDWPTWPRLVAWVDAEGNETRVET